MGSQQLFCLRWSNHQTNMLSVFDQLLQSEALVDVTLACEGLSLRAHKVVLSACSPYFQALFMENPCKHPIVILKDIKYLDLRALVDFMYKGEVNVTQEQLSALLKTAETLKVKGLAEMTGGGGGVSSSNSLSTLPASMGSGNRLSMGGGSRTPPPPNSLPPNVPPLSMGVPVSSASPIPPHPALQQIPPTQQQQQHQHHRSLSPPSSKRRKLRPPHRTSREPTPQSSDVACDATGTHSDCNDEDGDSLDLQGSPEVLETKVEVPSEAFGPSADQDSHPDPLPELQMDLTPSESHDDSAVAYPNCGPNTSNTNLSLSHSAPTTPPTSLLPPPPPPSSLPPSLPSTSGTQPASQDIPPITFFANIASMQEKEGFLIRDERGQPAKASSNGTTMPMVRIGPNTMVDAGRYACIDWSSGKRATKHLLQAVFGRHVLATHSLSGKPSNAFCYKQPKPQLDPGKVADITRLKPIEYVLNDPYWLDRPPPKLAIALARKCIFGDDVLKQSNLTSRNNMKPLDHEKLELIKKCVRWVYSLQSEEEFELTWAKCKTAIQQKCKHLRYYPSRKMEMRDMPLSETSYLQQTELRDMAGAALLGQAEYPISSLPQMMEPRLDTLPPSPVAENSRELPSISDRMSSPSQHDLN